MTYSNHYKKPLSIKLINALNWTGINLIIFIALTIALIAVWQFGFITSKITSVVLPLAVIITSIHIYKFFTFLLIIEPNEESIEINDNSITIKYSIPKKNREIDFRNIDSISFNRLSNNNSAIINIKRDKDEFGIDFELIHINSLDSHTLRELSNKINIPLHFRYELEEFSDYKSGIFGKKIENDDVYVIRKNLRNKEEKIDFGYWEKYANSNSKIKHLGTEEVINPKEKVESELHVQYALNTSYGLKSLDFMDGQLGISYAKNKTPKEIIEISEGLNLPYSNIMDI